MGIVNRKNSRDNPIIVDILTLMTPSVIENLSYIYHSLNRVSLTEVMQERLAEELEEIGYKPLVKPPPLSLHKTWEREDPLPAVIPSKEARGGPGFILKEQEKLKNSNKKLGQLEVLSLYREVAGLKTSKNQASIKSLGLLVNKLSA
jgi:hypothetical protein